MEVLVAKTTCIKCNMVCNPSDLDFDYECPRCQAKFYHKMMGKIGQDNDGQGKNKNLYYGNLTESEQSQVRKEAAKVHKIKFSNRRATLDHINMKFGFNISPYALTNITSHDNMRKHGLKWQYLIDKNK